MNILSTSPVTAGPQWFAGQRRRLLRNADLLTVGCWASVALVLALFLADGGAYRFGNWPDALTSVGIIAGLVGSDLVLVMLLLAARLPVVDHTIGHDRAMLLHRRLSKPSLYLLLAHAVFLLLGYGAAERLNPVAEALALWNTPDMPLAFIGLGLLVVVAVSSLVALRRRYPYEVWHGIHLLTYAAVLTGLPHQFSTGEIFAPGTLARWYWLALYLGTAVALAVFRIGLPLLTSARHRLQVSRVVQEAPGVVSVEMSGAGLERLGARGGQFFIWRFWAPGLWWQAHPFSLSTVPDAGTTARPRYASRPGYPVDGRGRRSPAVDGGSRSGGSGTTPAGAVPGSSNSAARPGGGTPGTVRITVRSLGRGTERLAALPPGTRVSVAGPYGMFTERARTSNRLVLIAAGIGASPVRSLLEQASFSPGNAVVMLRARRPEDLYLWQEIYELCEARGAQLYALLGPRPAGTASWLPASALESGYGLESYAPGAADSDIYVCGPRQWARLVIRDARLAGAAREQIHCERFDW